jgi:catechol 2,3-dioxygenase-like lactoylglutathione lyase family enzyme
VAGGYGAEVLDQSRLFHIGIRVTDIEAAMAEVGAHAGVTWASVQDRPMSVWLPESGPTELQLALTYSVEGPVHLELLQGPAGSIWDGHDAPGAHHFGYWSDDVGADTESMLADGWTLELAAVAPQDGYGRFTYVRSPSGYLVEPVSIASKPRFERWWAGGSLTDPIT